MEVKEMYTIKEVAEMLRVDTQTVRKYIKDGKIKAVKQPISRFLLIPFKEIEYLINGGTK